MINRWSISRGIKYHRYKQWFKHHTYKYRCRKIGNKQPLITIGVDKVKTKLRKKQIKKWCYIKYKTHEVHIFPKEFMFTNIVYSNERKVYSTPIIHKT